MATELISLNANNFNIFDIIFLNVDMPNYNSTKYAQMIKKYNKN